MSCGLNIFSQRSGWSISMIQYKIDSRNQLFLLVNFYDSYVTHPSMVVMFFSFVVMFNLYIYKRYYQHDIVSDIINDFTAWITFIASMQLAYRRYKCWSFVLIFFALPIWFVSSFLVYSIVRSFDEIFNISNEINSIRCVRNFRLAIFCLVSFFFLCSPQFYFIYLLSVDAVHLFVYVSKIVGKEFNFIVNCSIRSNDGKRETVWIEQWTIEALKWTMPCKRSTKWFISYVFLHASTKNK